MLNLIKYVNRMKKLLFFAVLALFMCSCEEKGPDVGTLHFGAFFTLRPIFVDIIRCEDNTLFLKDTINYDEYYDLPVGLYLVKAEREHYEDSTIVKIVKGEQTNIFLHLGYPW